MPASPLRPHTADAVQSVDDAVFTTKSMRRSDSTLFWRALALPYRGGVATCRGDADVDAGAQPGLPVTAASDLALGRSRPSLDALGPSCSLGAEAPQPRASEGRSSDEAGAERQSNEEVQGSCGEDRIDAAVPLGSAPSTHIPPAPSAQSSGTHKSRPRINARGAVAALRSSNPIRKVVDAVGEVPAVPEKPLVSLAIGDPTAYGLRAHESAHEALATAAHSGLFDGYAHSSGLPGCRAALAAHMSAQLPPSRSGNPAVRPCDVFMTHGASQALSLALGALANENVNVLLPRPGFPLYQTLCEYFDIECRYYDLNPEKNWEANPDQIRSLADSNTAALVVCTPGNPTGCVWSPAHVEQVLDAAHDIRAVVIADEVYAGIVWAPDAVSLPVAALAQHVPVLSVGALSKRYLVPGWRCGWLVVHDRGQLLAKSRILDAISHQVQMTIGPTVPVQACVPHVLANTPRCWHDDQSAMYAAAAHLCLSRVKSSPGLAIDCMPQGAMYLLVRLDLAGFDTACNANDVAWAAALQREEAVVLLPGTAFGAPGRVRLVLCATPAVLTAAWDRIVDFCSRHWIGRATSNGHLANGNGVAHH